LFGLGIHKNGDWSLLNMWC